MSKKETFYITTPIYYPSNKLHMGNAYPTVAADAMARFKRLRGYDVHFLTGTDEHGQKIQRQAELAGKKPIDFVDDIVAWIKELWKELNISYDDFIRTTEPRHKEAVQKIFDRFYHQGDIYKGKYEGWYCTPCEAFWLERQLDEGNCPDCGRKAEKVAEEAYFFRMSKYADRLLKYMEEHEDFILPVSRKNEMINNFLKPGLEELCVSRSTFDWGIPVSFDKNYVIYVWLDALSNYITALGYMSGNDELFKRYWPADVHLIGKEIVRFHTIYWPIFLMALDLPLPKKVFGHGWLILQEGKMSKSKGNVIDPRLLIKRYSADAIRYYLLREIPFGADGVFTVESLVQRLNYDLANDLGNLVSRSLTMLERYFKGVLPPSGADAAGDEELIGFALKVPGQMDVLMNDLQFGSALTELWQLVRQCNKYIDKNAPWDLAKDSDGAGMEKLKTVMYNLTEGIRFIAVLLQPYMPQTAESILEQLGLAGQAKYYEWQSLKEWGAMKPGGILKRGEDLFPRLNLNTEIRWSEGKEENEENENNIGQKDQDGKKDKERKEESFEEGAGLIGIEDFQRVELKVGEIIAAGKVPKADKLLLLQVQLGELEVRQIVAGIALSYSPEELKGKKVIVVTNLAPVKLRGILSSGMLLAASDGFGNLSLISPERDMAVGSRIS